MKINIIIIIMLSLLGMAKSLAIDVGDITSFIESDKTSLSKEIKNTTNSGRLINISVERISSPLDDGVIIPMDSKDELLLTPASLLMPAETSEVIRFYYKGLEDSKERYYRINWFDQALSDMQSNNSTRSATATSSARIGTILVVAPRKINYSYQYSNGTIFNIGNATIRIVAYGPCLKQVYGNECKESYYVLPNNKRKFKRVNVDDSKGRIALWQGEQFVPVK